MVSITVVSSSILTSWPGRSTPESDDLRGCIKSSDGDGGLKKCGDIYPELAESAELAPSFWANLAAAASSCTTRMASQVAADASFVEVVMHRKWSGGSGLIRGSWCWWCCSFGCCRLFISITVLRPGKNR